MGAQQEQLKLCGGHFLKFDANAGWWKVETTGATQSKLPLLSCLVLALAYISIYRDAKSCLTDTRTYSKLVPWVHIGGQDTDKNVCPSVDWCQVWTKQKLDDPYPIIRSQMVCQVEQNRGKLRKTEMWVAFQTCDYNLISHPKPFQVLDVIWSCQKVWYNYRTSAHIVCSKCSKKTISAMKRIGKHGTE